MAEREADGIGVPTDGSIRIVARHVVVAAGAWSHRLARTLGDRIPLQGLPTELADLASTFNAMLDRLQRSFDQVSRFSADIVAWFSHASGIIISTAW